MSLPCTKTRLGMLENDHTVKLRLEQHCQSFWPTVPLQVNWPLCRSERGKSLMLWGLFGMCFALLFREASGCFFAIGTYWVSNFYPYTSQNESCCFSQQSHKYSKKKKYKGSFLIASHTYPDLMICTLSLLYTLLIPSFWYKFSFVCTIFFQNCFRWCKQTLVQSSFIWGLTVFYILR